MRSTRALLPLLSCLMLFACGGDDPQEPTQNAPRSVPWSTTHAPNIPTMPNRPVTQQPPQQTPADAPASQPADTNRARFTYSVDLQGVQGTLTMDVEVIGSSGIVWGPGNRPDIRGLIGTGDYTIYTAGTLTSPTSSYAFTGENAFADFTETSSFERFRVKWELTQTGLRMIVNPFGPGPVTYDCVLKNAEPK